MESVLESGRRQDIALAAVLESYANLPNEWRKLSDSPASRHLIRILRPKATQAIREAQIEYARVQNLRIRAPTTIRSTSTSPGNVPRATQGQRVLPLLPTMTTPPLSVMSEGLQESPPQTRFAIERYERPLSLQSSPQRLSPPLSVMSEGLYESRPRTRSAIDRYERPLSLQNSPQRLSPPLSVMSEGLQESRRIANVSGDRQQSPLSLMSSPQSALTPTLKAGPEMPQEDLGGLLGPPCRIM